MIFGRLRPRAGWDGTTGVPRSANAASSLHLTWDAPDAPWTEAEAVLEVLRAPSVPALSFWALQVSFVDRGRQGGGAHLGLQWYPVHPGSTAVNWGGYAPGGGELDGSRSSLASATGNLNTRDLAWLPGRAYRLRVSPGSTGAPSGLHAWQGEVTDLSDGTTTVVRDLWAAGPHLSGAVVWSEVFARCDDRSASVRWSAMRLRAADASVHDVTAVSVNYQAVADGGCVTTDSSADAHGIVQTTGTVRVTPQGTRLAVPRTDPEIGRA